jgi:hypothetical protein
VFDHVVSPDEALVWCTDLNAPADLRERWIPHEEWLKSIQNLVRCPSCDGFVRIVSFEHEGGIEEELEDECTTCGAWLDLQGREPLRIREYIGDEVDVVAPIDVDIDGVRLQGELAFQVQSDTHGEVDDDDLLRAFNRAMHELPNRIIRSFNIDGGIDLSDFEFLGSRERHIMHTLADGEYESEEE